MFGCSNDGLNDFNFPSIKFDVQEELLSEIYYIDGEEFSFRVPKRFSSVSDSDFTKLKTFLINDSTAYFPIVLLNAFVTKSGMSCIVSKINKKNVFNKLNKNYMEILKNNFNTDNIIRGEFSIHNIKVIQYTISSKEIVGFKLYCFINNKYYQIDYFLPVSIYEEESKGIESSIGSITT